MMLIINVCKEKLHYLEFVKPIEDILKENKIKFFTKNYLELKDSDIKKSGRIIITGTSLKDFDYVIHLDKFSWIKGYGKPLLGICAGMQIIGLIFGGKLGDNKYIGLDFENFGQDFADLFFDSQETLQQVYHLHNRYITLPENFKKENNQLSVPIAFRHKEKPIYGVLFHPEVRNREIIKNFARL